MRDISRKTSTLRTATAEATLTLSPATVALIREQKIPKGNPLEIARVAAIQAAKNTGNTIPFCHQVPLDHVAVEFEMSDNRIRVQTTVKAVYKTGVEMEALTAASVAVLTLYDMLKMLDDTMEIVGVKLLCKQGGKSSYAAAPARLLRAAVVVMSDSCSAGTKEDQSGKTIVARLKDEGMEVVDCKIIPDDGDTIVQTLINYADRDRVDLILTTGGTGFGPRDVTPEGMAQVIERETPGIAELIRAHGSDRTPYAMLSRGKAGIRGKCLIVNLPGSVRGVSESLDALFPSIVHALGMLWGTSDGHSDDRGAPNS
jgi:molybdenum cofactor biosynthesis protein MoaC